MSANDKVLHESTTLGLSHPIKDDIVIERTFI